MRAERRAQAEADFDAALALEPTLEPAWLGKAQIGMLAGNIAQAIVACKKALEQNPTSEIGLARLGACFASLGDAAAAIQHFDRALEIKSDCEEAIGNKIFYLDFLPEADFAVKQAARTILVGYDRLQIPQAETCGSAARPVEAHRRWICIGRLQESLGGIRLLAGVSIPRQNELSDQLLLVLGRARFNDRRLRVAGRRLG